MEAPEANCRPVAWRPLLAILVLALCIRFASVLLWPEQLGGGAGGFGDTHLYHRLAYHLATGHGYSGVFDNQAYGLPGPEPRYEPTIARGPTYPVFLAAIYRLNLPQQPEDWVGAWQRVRLVQALLDGLVCLAVFSIALDLKPDDPRPALWASGLYALNPYSLYYCRALLSESVTIFCMAASLACLMRALRGQRVRVMACSSGVAMAAVAMCRAEYTLFGVLLAGLIAWCCEPSRRKHTVVYYTLGFLLCLLPWTARTSLVAHRFMPTPSGATGVLMFQGTFETNTNWVGWSQYPADLRITEAQRAELQQQTRRVDELFQQGLVDTLDCDRFFKELAREQWRIRPGEALQCCLVRIPRLWYQVQIPMYPVPEPGGGFILVYLAFAAVGLRHYPLRRTLPLLGVPLFITAVFFPLHVESRYCVSSLPAVIALAGLGVAQAVRRSDPHESAPAAAPRKEKRKRRVTHTLPK